MPLPMTTSFSVIVINPRLFSGGFDEAVALVEEFQHRLARGDVGAVGDQIEPLARAGEPDVEHLADAGLPATDPVAGPAQPPV